MNCKQGDLALIFRSKAGNNGLMVMCLELASEEYLRKCRVTNDAGPVWVIDREIQWANPFMGKGDRLNLCMDSTLIPIRPDDVSHELDEVILDRPKDWA